MTIDLNHYIGKCGSCEGDVKMCHILGWGLVPGSAQCTSCNKKAQISNGNIVITMVQDEQKLLEKLKQASWSPEIVYEVVSDNQRFGHKSLRKKI